MGEKGKYLASVRKTWLHQITDHILDADLMYHIIWRKTKKTKQNSTTGGRTAAPATYIH